MHRFKRLPPVALLLVAAACAPEPGEEEGFKPGEPIEVPEAQHGEWVWVDMPSMRCSDGTAGGFAVNFVADRSEVVLYLQGGGICYDEITCLLGGAASSIGKDPLRTSLDGSIRNNRGIFDRSDATNPFRNSNFVVVPHCTGDHHTGDREATYGQETYHHVGYTNLTRVAERLVATFKDATRVTLSGFSAGGVGITANYHQLASAFESVGQPSPYLVIDSGPFLRPQYLEPQAQATLRENWGLDRTVGAFCPSCLSDGFHELYRINAQLHPGLRSSLVCTLEDDVVRLLYDVLNETRYDGERLRQGLLDLADWHQTTSDDLAPSLHRVFLYEGTRHGALNVAALADTPGLSAFLEGQLGEGDWENVLP